MTLSDLVPDEMEDYEVKEVCNAVLGGCDHLIARCSDPETIRRELSSNDPKENRSALVMIVFVSANRRESQPTRASTPVVRRLRPSLAALLSATASVSDRGRPLVGVDRNTFVPFTTCQGRPARARHIA